MMNVKIEQQQQQLRPVTHVVVVTRCQPHDPSLQAMYDACDRLARRPLPEPAEVDAVDFEREARVYTSASKERDALSSLLAVKDNMIWTLVEERNKLQRRVGEGNAEIEALRSELAAVRSAQPVIYAPTRGSTAAAVAAGGANAEPKAPNGEGDGVEGAREKTEETAPGSVKLVLNVTGQ